jgi:GntP family gluconate:H+ symporter
VSFATQATQAAPAAEPTASNSLLVTAAVLGIAVVVLLITLGKVHPFLSLIAGAAVLGLVAGFGAENTIESFSAGVGDTVGGVGLLIAIGAMIGGLLADSGSADSIVDRVVHSVSEDKLPWALAGVAALIGLPLFFEVGVVLLVPVVLLVSTRTRVPLMKIGIPALAGLSVLHGLVPPHPGPLVAISALNADLGLTLALGLLIAIPTVIIAGPVFGSFVGNRILATPPEALLPTHEVVGAGSTGRSGDADVDRAVDREEDVERYRELHGAAPGAAATIGRRRPAFGPAVITILVPVVLMLLRAIGELLFDEGNALRAVLTLIGTPVVALLAGLVLAMITMGFRAGFTRSEVSATVGGALPGIAGILLIVGAGGGFKQVLIDAGVGEVVAQAAEGANISALVLGWLVAVGIRLATGSATVATITAAGIVTPLAAGLPSSEVALLVLAIGSGSLFFSHVNDAGFWLVKEYFGLTVGETIRSWSVMETIISVVGLAGVLLLSVVF